MKRALACVIAALNFGLLAVPAIGKPVTDCPLRNAPFSADSPLMDILLSDAARAVLNRRGGGRFTGAPDGFLGTRAPSFAAILTLRTGTRFTGMTEPAIAMADRELRALPITPADRIARCARYDNDVPVFAKSAGRPRVLLFEKMTGFKDVPSVNAAHAAFVEMAQRKDWALEVTDKGGAFNARTLRMFDAVIWNNISGDVLTLSQRRALQRYMQRGGGFVAIHGAAGDPTYFWDWYADRLIGARFLGHPRDPQFQNARILVNTRHPLAGSLPGEWLMTEEWYSFRTNPRSIGAEVLLALDESSYNPNGPNGQDLSMGADHPIAWTNCIGKGRMFYSAIGHRPEVYEDPRHLSMLESAISWAVTARDDCSASAALRHSRK